MDIIKKGPRGEYRLLECLRRAKIQNRTGAYFGDDAAEHIEDQAAEIAKLTAERDEAERCAVTEIAKRERAEAQAAKMREALERIASVDATSGLALIEIARQALATDAGKAAADVLAATGNFLAWCRSINAGPTTNQPGREAHYLREMQQAWAAYRAEGQGDG